MEEYLGLSVETLQAMRKDYIAQLVTTQKENDFYPKDGHLYKRVKSLCNTIDKLTRELEFRFDEQIEKID